MKRAVAFLLSFLLIFSSLPLGYLANAETLVPETTEDLGEEETPNPLVKDYSFTYQAEDFSRVNDGVKIQVTFINLGTAIPEEVAVKCGDRDFDLEGTPDYGEAVVFSLAYTLTEELFKEEDFLLNIETMVSYGEEVESSEFQVILPYAPEETLLEDPIKALTGETGIETMGLDDENYFEYYIGGYQYSSLGDEMTLWLNFTNMSSDYPSAVYLEIEDEIIEPTDYSANYSYANFYHYFLIEEKYFSDGDISKDILLEARLIAIYDDEEIIEDIEFQINFNPLSVFSSYFPDVISVNDEEIEFELEVRNLGPFPLQLLGYWLMGEFIEEERIIPEYSSITLEFSHIITEEEKLAGHLQLDYSFDAHHNLDENKSYSNTYYNQSVIKIDRNFRFNTGSVSYNTLNEEVSLCVEYFNEGTEIPKKLNCKSAIKFSTPIHMQMTTTLPTFLIPIQLKRTYLLRILNLWRDF